MLRLLVSSSNVYAKIDGSIVISCVIELEVYFKVLFALLRLVLRFLTLGGAAWALESVIVKLSACLLSILAHGQLLFAENLI